eukprot:Clim_evm10s213 gene=Clim_evmTU10s213
MGVEPGFSVQEYMDQAMQLLESGNMDLALQFTGKAMESARLQDNSEAFSGAVEAHATILIEQGSLDEASSVLKEAIRMCPDQGHLKYFMLGQLEQEDPIQQLRYYGNSVRLMEQTAGVTPGHAEAGGSVPFVLSTEVPQFEESDDRSAYVQTLVAMAEVYLTDACMEPDAGEQCERLLRRALSVDEKDWDALQSLASWHISMCDPQSASEALDASMGTWRHLVTAARRTQDVNGQDQNGAEDEDDTAMATDEPENTDQREPPTLEFRCNTVKLLLELGRYNDATELIEAILMEDDDFVQAWYLLGWCHHLQEGHEQEAADFLNHAKKIWHKVEWGDEPLLKHCEDLLTELKSKGVEPSNILLDNDEDEPEG